MTHSRQAARVRAQEYFDVTPDLCTLAKALGGGTGTPADGEEV